jgi:hypothetical protein
MGDAFLRVDHGYFHVQQQRNAVKSAERLNANTWGIGPGMQKSER